MWKMDNIAVSIDDATNFLRGFRQAVKQKNDVKRVEGAWFLPAI